MRVARECLDTVHGDDRNIVECELPHIAFGPAEMHA